MSKYTALTLCIVFIIYCFVNDAKRRPKVSFALWVPFLWFVFFASRPLSLWLNFSLVAASPDYDLEGSPADRALFTVLIVIGLIILIKRKADWPNILKNNKFIFIYISYLGISTLWSDFPFVAFKRWIKEIGNIIMVLLMLTEADPIEAIKTFFKRFTYLLIPLSIVFNKYFPDLGRMYAISGGAPQYMGVATHKNSLGAICFVCGIFLFWNLLLLWRHRREGHYNKDIFVHLLYLVMIASLLYEAHSATAIAATIIGLCVISWLELPGIKNNVKLIKYYALFLILILTIVHLAFDLPSLITASLGRDETLTGRTQMWDEVLNMKTNPLIGTGFDSFWLGKRKAYFWNKYWWHPNQSHNGYLEIYINLGYIGLILIFMILYSVFRNINRNLIAHHQYDYQVIRIAFFIIMVAVNITEANFKSFIWLVFLLTAFSLAPAAPIKQNI